MFFIMGIDSKHKMLPYNSNVFICNRCGQYGRYEVFITYMCFSLFFIPIIKWNKRYIVRTTCCQTQYELDPAIGQAIERGHDVEIIQEHLQLIGGYSQQVYRRCEQCGFSTMDDFQFCPKCGKPFGNYECK